MKKILLTICLLSIFTTTSCSRINTGEIMGQAVAVAKEGRYSDVLELTRICLNENPHLVDALLLDSFCRFRLGKTPEEKRLALYNLAKCTRLEPERFDCWFFYGWALVEAERFTDAVSPLEHAGRMLERNSPHRHTLQLLLGRCYLENNLCDRALSILQPLQIREPYNRMPELYHSLGLASIQAQRPATALRLFQSGLRLCPDSPLLLQDLAVTSELYGNDYAATRDYYIRLLASIPPGEHARRLAVQKCLSRAVSKAGKR